ncbi:MAG: hypothetical protein V9F00_10580 [Nocardioides sp.]
MVVVVGVIVVVKPSYTDRMKVVVVVMVSVTSGAGTVAVLVTVGAVTVLTGMVTTSAVADGELTIARAMAAKTVASEATRFACMNYAIGPGGKPEVSFGAITTLLAGYWPARTTP